MGDRVYVAICFPTSATSREPLRRLKESSCKNNLICLINAIKKVCFFICLFEARLRNCTYRVKYPSKHLNMHCDESEYLLSPCSSHPV